MCGDSGMGMFEHTVAVNPPLAIRKFWVAGRPTPPLSHRHTHSHSLQVATRRDASLPLATHTASSIINRLSCIGQASPRSRRRSGAKPCPFAMVNGLIHSTYWLLSVIILPVSICFCLVNMIFKTLNIFNFLPLNPSHFFVCQPSRG